MSKRNINRILALFLSLVMTLSLLPATALAADSTAVTITSAGVGTTADQVTVAFTGPTSSDTTVSGFYVKAYYTYTTNGHEYKIDRRSLSVSTNAEGSYSCTFYVPMNIDQSGNYPLYASVVTEYKDGTTEETEGVELSSAPQRTSSYASLTVSIPVNEEKEITAKTYTYAYSGGETPTNTFVDGGENGVSFDMATRTLTISGNYGAQINLDSLYAGYDLNALVLNNATFGTLYVQSHKPLPIALIGSNTGNIQLEYNADLLITAYGTPEVKPSLTGAIISHANGYRGSDTSNVVMSNITYNATADGLVTALAAAAFDNCTVNIIQTGAADSALNFSGNGAGGSNPDCTRINDCGLVVKDCADFRVTSSGSCIGAGNGGVLFDGTHATITHNNNYTKMGNNFVAIGGSVPVTVQNSSILTVDCTDSHGGTIYGLNVGDLTVDQTSKLDVTVSSPTGAIIGQHGVIADGTFLLQGTAEIDMSNENLGDSRGVSAGTLKIDGGTLTTTSAGHSHVDGANVSKFVMQNNAKATVNITTTSSENTSRYLTGVYAEHSGSVTGSTLEINLRPGGTVAPYIRSLYFGGYATNKVTNSALRIGVHNTGNTLDSQYTYAYEGSSVAVSGSTVVVRVPENCLSSAQSQLSDKLTGAVPDVKVCTCTASAIDENCLGTGGAVVEASRLTVKVPETISGKAKLPDSARLLATRNSTQQEIWSGKISDVLNVYSFTKQTYGRLPCAFPGPPREPSEAGRVGRGGAAE